MIRVLIRAQSPAVRAGLEALLRDYDSLQVVEEIPEDDDAAGISFVDMQPDVILAELNTRDDDIASSVFRDAPAGVPVVLLARDPAEEWLTALRQGAKAVLPDNASGPQIAAAIEAVAAGLTVLHSSGVEGLLTSRATTESLETLPEPLTAREIEVLRSMAEGLANKEIASGLGISEHTVKFHVASIMGKLGAASRTEAVMAGIRHGLVLI